MVDGTRNGVHLAPLFRRQPRGDQRAAGGTCLDHQHTQRESADDAVAPGKVCRQRRAVQRQLRNQRAATLDDAPRQRLVAPRIEPAQAGAEDCHGRATSLQRALVGGAIDAQGQPAGDGEAALRQAARKAPGGAQPGGAGAAAADHRQLRPFQSLRSAFDVQQRRGIGDFGEQCRVSRVVPHQQVPARTFQPAQGFTRRFPHRRAAPRGGGLGRHSQGAPGAGWRGKRGRGRTEGLDQAQEAHGSQFGQAMQAQPCFQFGWRMVLHRDSSIAGRSIADRKRGRVRLPSWKPSYEISFPQKRETPAEAGVSSQGFCTLSVTESGLLAIRTRA